MATEITMPQLSDTMDQGTILTWLKKEGEAVERGDELAEVGTDKADLPVESFYQGTLLKIFAAEGTTVKVGEVIAIIGEPGEAIPEGGSSTGSSVPATSSTVDAQAAVGSVSAPVAPVQTSPAPSIPTSSESEARVKASPLAKKIAASKGLDLSSIQGSGEGGRIVRRDVEGPTDGHAQGTIESSPIDSAPALALTSVAATSAVAAAPVAQAAPKSQPVAGGSSTTPLSKMRQAIATRMVEATNTIPHFYLTSAIKVDALANLRKSLKTLDHYEGVTYNHLIVKGVAKALKSFPRINSYYSESNLIEPGEINIGIITAVDDGLLIPVLKGVDQMPLSDVVAEAKGLVSRARAGRPKGSDLSGATFCVSNVGAYPVESFTAVISPGNGGILAVGAIGEEAVVEDGDVVVRKVMRVTLSVDHRIIDGVMGAEFLAKLKSTLEDPALLLA